MSDLNEKEAVVETSPEPEPEKTPPLTTTLSPAKDGRSKARTQQQIEATEKMKSGREAARKRKREEIEVKSKEVEKKEYDDKSIALASAMFYDLRKKEKGQKKQVEWEEQLSRAIDARMSDFEDRIVDMFHEPIDHFMSRGKKQKLNVGEKKIESGMKMENNTLKPTAKKSYTMSNPFSRK